MSKKKILLVDDEVSLVKILKLQLESYGYQVLFAYNGEDALKIVHENTPDLIVLDLILPGLSGYMICSLIKNDKRFVNIPIIMCTARIQDEDIKLGEKVGANAYITKPFENQLLIDKIKELLKE